MIDKPITSKLALLLYNLYKVNYCTCLAIQELEEKAKKYDDIKEENKVLVEGVKVLLNDRYTCIEMIEDDGRINGARILRGDKDNPVDHLIKIKAMLELAEVKGNE